MNYQLRLQIVSNQVFDKPTQKREIRKHSFKLIDFIFIYFHLHHKKNLFSIKRKGFYFIKNATLFRVFLAKIFYSANACLKPCTLFHPPRVKSGISTGALLFSKDKAVSGAKQHHSARSYTSISNGRPFCKQ